MNKEITTKRYFLAIRIMFQNIIFNIVFTRANREYELADIHFCLFRGILVDRFARCRLGISFGIGGFNRRYHWKLEQGYYREGVWITADNLKEDR